MRPLLLGGWKTDGLAPRVDILFQILGNLFGWLVVLLAICFKLPDITQKPYVSVGWLLSAATIGVAYLLPLAVVAKHRGLKKTVMIFQIAGIFSLFPFFIYGFKMFKIGKVTIFGTVEIGNTCLWFTILGFLLLIGSVCGLVRTMYTRIRWCEMAKQEPHQDKSEGFFGEMNENHEESFHFRADDPEKSNAE
jgi:hypothetical protein